VYPPLRRENFAHSPHIGTVSSVDASPFHRNLFLSAGADGTVQLLHMLERAPLRQWEPLASAPCAGADDTGKQSTSKGCSVGSTAASISAVQFSPVRPTVFAAASSDGLLFIYDLRASGVAPVKVVEAPLTSPHAAALASPATDSRADKAHSRAGRAEQLHTGSGSCGRAGLTGIAFSPRQRDLVAACDWLGRVHIWKLGWRLANRYRDEQAILNEIGNVGGSSTSDAAADAPLTTSAAAAGDG
jgi:WD40 repeat protein